MKANYKDNPNKTLKVLGHMGNDVNLRMHVFEPAESSNQQDWYKDMTTFNNMNMKTVWSWIQIGDIVEDDTGARFRILSKHWKWDKDESGTAYGVLEFTVERYIRHGKQNPYMI